MLLAFIVRNKRNTHNLCLPFSDTITQPHTIPESRMQEM